MASAPVSVEDRLRSEFCPPLDHALLSALLLDFPNPPSTEDEWLLRATLTSLASDVEAEEQLEHADAEGAPRDASDVVSSRSGAGIESSASRGTGGTADRSTSDLGNALEVWSLGGDDEGDAEAEGRRFWEGSRVSTTSSESLSAEQQELPKQQQEVPDDPLAFLANVFPTMSLDELETRLVAGGSDLEGIVDELLSQAFITSITSEESDSPSSSTPATPRSKVDKQARRRAKAVLKASTTLSLTSTPHLLSPAQSPALSAASPVTLNSPAISQALPSTNRWASLSSHSTNLSTLLHVTPARITSTYHACSSSLALTLATLLNALAISRPFAEIVDAELLKAQLATVLPGVKGDRLEMLLSATEGDLADAMDLQATIGEIERTEGKMAWTEIIEIDPQASSSSVVVTKPPPPPALDSLSANSTAANPEQRYSSADCYYYEEEFARRRNEAIRSAARHFQRGGMAQRGAAYYWAEEGRVLDGKRRVWAERGARAVVRERRIWDKNTIDLHGLTLHHAQTVVREGVTSWWASSSTGTPPPLRIITGLGRHSTHNNPILLPAITKLLDREGWRWKWDSGDAGRELADGKRGAVLVLGVSR